MIASLPEWFTVPGDPWVLVMTGTADAAAIAAVRSAVAATATLPVRTLAVLGPAVAAAHLIPEPALRVVRDLPDPRLVALGAVVIGPPQGGVAELAARARVPFVAVAPTDEQRAAVERLADRPAAVLAGRRSRARHVRRAVAALLAASAGD